MTTMDIHQILKKLPHRYPILLVDRVVELEKGQRIRAIKNVTINEPFFPGHFPHYPVMPGVLIIEALAQTAGALCVSSLGEDYKAAARVLHGDRQGQISQTRAPRRRAPLPCPQDQEPRPRLALLRRGEG